MLYLVGAGLSDAGDLPLAAKNVLQAADHLFFETYTHRYQSSLAELRDVIGRDITPLTRVDVEQNAGEHLFSKAKKTDVALLVGGDPLVATTHVDLVLEARKRDIAVRVIHASSILSAIGETGLMPYKFGRTASIPLWEEHYAPESFYDILQANHSIDAHTLFLLDIKADVDRYMSVNEAIRQLLAVSEKSDTHLFGPDTLCVGAARLGADDAHLAAGAAKALLEHDFGPPPHILVVPATTRHFMEEEALASIRID